MIDDLISEISESSVLDPLESNKQAKNYCSHCKANTINKFSTCSICKRKLPFKCIQCNKHYKNRHSLTSHMKFRCNRKPNIFCDACHYKTTRKSDLVRHIKSMHRNAYRNLKNYNNTCVNPKKTCIQEEVMIDDPVSQLKVASVSAASGSNIVRSYCCHCKSNTIDESSVCLICKEKLPYKCTLCNQCFKSKSSLQSHLSYTCKQNKNMIFCDMCSYKTTRKGNLITHIRSKHPDTITKLMPYKCSKCIRTFNVRSVMLTHQKDCGENNFYQCQECNYVGTNIFALRNHKSSKHKKTIH